MKKVKIICNPNLVAGAIVLTLLMTVLCIGAVYVLGLDGVIASQKDVLPSRLLFLFWLVMFYLGMLLSIPRVFSFVTLSDEEIIFFIPFRKRVTCGYSRYPNIYRARYFHGNIGMSGYWCDYIIISQIVLSREALIHANNLPISEEVIKIKYNNRIYQKLYDIFPVSHKNKLQKAFKV